MSNEKREIDLEGGGEEPTKGLNLTLVYSLIAVALLAAICIAFFIVYPFYQRSH